jgi:hypothetical protein
MPKDLLLDDGFDIVISNGDFAVGECTAQCKRSLILISPGEIRQWPPVGVGIVSQINSEDMEGLEYEIRRQFELDGLNVQSLEINNGVVNEESSYE